MKERRSGTIITVSSAAARRAHAMSPFRTLQRKGAASRSPGSSTRRTLSIGSWAPRRCTAARSSAFC
jgi:hypothetical protein